MEAARYQHELTNAVLRQDRLLGTAMHRRSGEVLPEPPETFRLDTSPLHRLATRKPDGRAFHGNDLWGPLLPILKAASIEVRGNDQIAIRWGELCARIPEAKRYCAEKGINPASIDADRIGKLLKRADEYL